MNPDLIETSEQMDALTAQLSGVKLIAVDTEFFRETTYYPQLALVQIATDSFVACIDPLAFDARQALKNILLDDDIIKVFHSCSQDLEVLYYYLGEIPKSIYDTQIANALLTDFHQIGYASLVENELGVTLDKSQTRTNWLQRPLTDKQIQYAGDDVLFLYQLHHILDKKLLESGRKSWFEEDSETLNKSGGFQLVPDKLWQRVKGAGRLPRNKLAIVQAVALWREQLAQDKDRTRRKILGDDILVNIALNPPENISILDQTITNRYHFSSDEKLQLLTVIRETQQASHDSWPDNRFNVLDATQKQLLKELQHLINKCAEESGIASAVLCSKKDLETLMFHCQNRPEDALPQLNIVQGWRIRHIGQHLIETISHS